MTSGIDNDLCEGLVARAVSGEDAAWHALVEHLWPVLRRHVQRSRIMGSFARSEDHVHDVLARFIEHLGRDGGHGLRLYAPWHAKNPERTFGDWVRIVIATVMRRHVSEQFTLESAESGDALPSVKRLLNEFALSREIEEIGVRPPLTDAQTAQQLLVFARGQLPAVQLRALMLWLEGEDFADIAVDLALSGPRAAERTLRAAMAVLRRHFARLDEG